MSDKINVKALKEIITNSIAEIQSRLPNMTRLSNEGKKEIPKLLKSINENIAILEINQTNPEMVNNMSELIKNACDNIYAHVMSIESKRAKKVGDFTEKIKSVAETLSTELGFKLAG